MNSSQITFNHILESKQTNSPEPDLEAQNMIIPISSVNSNLLEPLKGILKNTSTNVLDTRTLLAVKHFTLTLLVVTMTPLFCCDIYFGLYSNYCVNDTTDGFNFTMKLYLVVSGIVGLVGILIVIYSNLILSNDINNIGRFVCVKQTVIFGEIFQMIWNTIGAIKWTFIIYRDVHCEHKILLYVTVSIIIKFIGHILLLLQKCSLLKK